MKYLFEQNNAVYMVMRSGCMLLHWNEFARILLDFDKVIIVVDDKEKKIRSPVS